MSFKNGGRNKTISHGEKDRYFKGYKHLGDPKNLLETNGLHGLENLYSSIVENLSIGDELYGCEIEEAIYGLKVIHALENLLKIIVCLKNEKFSRIDTGSWGLNGYLEKLKPLADKPLVGHIYQRLVACSQIKTVVLATTQDPLNNSDYCIDLGMKVYRETASRLYIFLKR